MIRMSPCGSPNLGAFGPMAAFQVAHGPVISAREPPSSFGHFRGMAALCVVSNNINGEQRAASSFLFLIF